MHGALKAWISRLLAAVMMLALVSGSVTGAYAHAAGHTPPSASHAAHTLQTADADSTVVVTAVANAMAAAADHSHGQHHGGQGHGQPGHCAADCCDTICHGGQAILAADAVAAIQVHAAPVIQPCAAFDGAEPGGLDRPPKAFLPA